MITEQERVIRKSQGYDIDFEQNGKKYWINSNEWDKEKEARLYKETGLKTFREYYGEENLVVYDPEYFEDQERFLGYIGNREKNIPQPINMSSGWGMFSQCSLKGVDLSGWDMHNVISISRMFYECENLMYINMASCDFSNVRTMYAMFACCKKLKELYLPSNFKNATKDATDELNEIFFRCDKLYEKYGTVIDSELLQKIIEDSNRSNLTQLKAF